MQSLSDDDCFVFPLNFRKVSGSKQEYLVTNLSGQFTFLESHKELSNLIEGKISSLRGDIINELLAKGIVAIKQESQTRLNLIASKLAQQVRNNLYAPSLFLVVPTLRCDHSCLYCQVSRVPENREGYDLQKKHIDTIVNIIKRTKSKEIKVEFQGGEPLLAIGFIEDFIKIASVELGNKNVQYVICTSLTKNIEKILPLAKEHNINFSVSLDGDAETHNTNRPNKYYDAYFEMHKNIKKIKKEVGADNISCISTITQASLSRPKELIDSYINLGLESIFLRPLSPYGFAKNQMKHIGYTIHDFLAFYKEALEYIFEINHKTTFIEETTLIHLKKIFRPSENNYVDLKSPAGHLLGALLFNYDGNIYGSDEARMIWQETRNDLLSLGHLDDFSIEKMVKHSLNLLSDTFLFSNPGCDDCAFNMFCGADPMFHLSTQGDHIGNKAISDFCKLERGIFDHIFSLYKKGGNEKEIFQKWLNH